MLKKMLVASLVCIASLAEAITLVSPKDGAVVPLLSEKQKAFMAMGREERAKFFDDAQPKMEREIKGYRSVPRPVVLEWRGDGGPYEVSVTRRGAEKPWFAAAVATNRVEVWNLEIAATYDWTVRGGGKIAKGSFMTEDQAPRLIRIPKVPNVRDLGGRVIDGRRVRQGLVYRSSGLNNNATTVFYTLDEIKKLEAEGTLASMGELGAKYSAKLKSGKELDRKFLRLIKSEPKEPGTARLTEEWRKYMVEQLGIKTDIDLRSTRERFGMTCSPLGEGVKFVTMPTNYHGYAAVHTSGAEDTRRVLRVFLDRSNYPIDFHCIGGADRTGTVATILHGILGLDDDEIWKDYQTTAWQGGINDAKHLKWFTDFVKSFDRFEGATLSERIRKYVLWLGFTEADMQKIRDIMLEPAGAAVVIYGATPAGIAAAVQARKMGLEPVVIEPTSRIGGLTTGGLGQTDIGNKAAFGGIARKFYQDIKAYYETDAAWKFQKREEYRPRGQSCWESGEDSMWTFEPSAALKVLESWEKDWALVIHRNERLDRGPGGVEKKDGRIVAIHTEGGRRYAAKMFLDCTYEGDLMAAAGVSYTVGREPNSKYGETISGIQRALMKNHQLNAGVDPYVRKGDPSSGLLPGIERDVADPDGTGDSRVQAYCFRMCLTDDPRNRIPFKKPAGYRELDYELLLRNLEAGPLDPGHNGMPWINSPMPNRKTDTNNRTGFSTDLIGGADRWPEASYAERDEIAAAHLKYQQGLMWTLANHPRVPDRIRNEVARWGTCRDEFVGERGDGWQNQLYVREARRMVGEYVMTEHECRGERVAPRPVGLGAYGMDSHNCRRYVSSEGFALNEGNIEDYDVNPPGSGKPYMRFPPYPIDYGAIVPRKDECENLFVPVCLSASHMAFGSIRMEPVFFALGQVAGTAAAQAIAAGCAVQDVDYAKLRARLLKDGQRLGQ